MAASCRGRRPDDLLVAPLDGAFAVEEVQHVPWCRWEDLDFDVTPRRDVRLDEHRRVTEGRLRLTGSGLMALARSAAASVTILMPSAAAGGRF